MARPGVMIYFDMANSLRGLSLEELGMVYQGIMDYAQNGVVPQWPEKLSLAWEMIRSRIDADIARYEEIAEKRREAGRRSHQAKEQVQQMQQMQPNINTNSNTNSYSYSNTETKQGADAQKAKAAAPEAQAAGESEEKKEERKTGEAGSGSPVPRRNPSDPKVIEYVSRQIQQSRCYGRNRYGRYEPQYAACWG